jgi:hypothetical protein
VYADYLVDDAQFEIVNRFLAVYLLWLFGFVIFCSSHGDAVSKFLISNAQRIADAPFGCGPQISWSSVVLVGTYRGCAQGCPRVV